MAECTVHHLMHAFEEICNTIGKDTELVNSFKAKIDSLKEVFNSKAVTHCFEKFINAELDYKTPGDRGLGRVSTHLPRLAAYFRKKITSLPSQDVDELYCLIQDLILRGYLVHVLFSEENLRPSTVSEPKELYEAWLPGIYAESPSQMSENMQKAFTVCTDSALGKIKAFFSKNDMRGGGFFSRDKTDEILMYYPFAGFGLRFEETRG
jgi:hypothetical protein